MKHLLFEKYRWKLWSSNIRHKEPPFFVLFGFIWSASQFLWCLLQTFLWFCLVNTPVTLDTVNVTLFWEWLNIHTDIYGNTYPLVETKESLIYLGYQKFQAATLFPVHLAFLTQSKVCSLSILKFILLPWFYSFSTKCFSWNDIPAGIF